MHKFRHRSTRLCVGTHVFNKFSEITQYNGHYVVQGHSRSPILVPIESSYRPTTSYYWLIVTYLLSCTVSKLWSNFRWREGSASLSLGVVPYKYRRKWYITKNVILRTTFPPQKVSVYLHFYVNRPESYRIRWNYAAVSAITPFKVIQGHRIWYQSKAHMRLPISR